MELTVDNISVAVYTFYIICVLFFQGVRIPELSVVLYAVGDSPVATLGISRRHFWSEMWTKGCVSTKEKVRRQRKKQILGTRHVQISVLVGTNPKDTPMFICINVRNLQPSLHHLPIGLHSLLSLHTFERKRKKKRKRSTCDILWLWLRVAFRSIKTNKDKILDKIVSRKQCIRVSVFQVIQFWILNLTASESLSKATDFGWNTASILIIFGFWLTTSTSESLGRQRH